MFKKIFVLFIYFILIYSLKVTASTTKIPVLLYHHILSDEENTYFRKNGSVISTEQFKKQMRYLHDNDFTTISLKQLQNFLYNKQPLPQKSVLITFDDGYYSNIINAYPVLKDYNFKAVIFPIGASIKEKQPQFSSDTFVFLGKDTIQNSTDVFEYASHTYDLHDFSELDNNKTKLMMATKDEIIKDLKNSFTFVDNVNAIAYPLGQYNSTILESIKELRIYMAFTVEPGYITKNSYGLGLNRFIIFPNTTIKKFEKIVNGSYK